MSHPTLMKYYRSDFERSVEGRAMPLVWSIILGAATLFTIIEVLI